MLPCTAGACRVRSITTCCLGDGGQYFIDTSFPNLQPAATAAQPEVCVHCTRCRRRQSRSIHLSSRRTVLTSALAVAVPWVLLSGQHAHHHGAADCHNAGRSPGFCSHACARVCRHISAALRHRPPRTTTSSPGGGCRVVRVPVAPIPPPAWTTGMCGCGLGRVLRGQQTHQR